MRIFYVFWFFFCAGWGFLLSSFPPDERDSVARVLLAFPVFLVIFGLLAFVALRSASLPASSARLSLGLRPWQKPLGVFAFVQITALFTSLWGIGFSLLFHHRSALQSLEVLALSLGVLAGASFACRVYRSYHAA